MGETPCRFESDLRYEEAVPWDSLFWFSREQGKSVMMRWMWVWVVVGFVGCDEGSGSVAEFEAQESFASASCALHFRCAPEYGQSWVDEASCRINTLLRWTGESGEGLNTDASPGSFRDCAEQLETMTCEAFYSGGVREGDCSPLFVRPAAAVARPAGDECSGLCEEGSSCVPWEPGGAGCYQCVAHAGEGEGCVDAECAESLYCGEGDVCVDPTGEDCTEARACGLTHLFFCNAASACERHEVGTPCEGNAFMMQDTRGQALVCIAGVSALPATEGEACDPGESLDCEPGLLCQEGVCSPLPGRDEPCFSTGLGAGACQGMLTCEAGVCTDRPGAGEPCEFWCQSPLLCVGGVCAESASGGETLGLGDSCSSGLGGLGQLGGAVCESGYCHPETRVCTAHAPLGASCASEHCDLEAYCEPSSWTCVARVELGEACTSANTCPRGARCYGACEGGSFEGKPCLGDYHCEGGACAGRCQDVSTEASMCALE